MTRQIFPGLTLLRAIAITLVMICHAALIATTAGMTATEPWRVGGTLGVDLFFALSGFLIGGLILDSGEGFREKSVLTGFWLSRGLRTLPNYFLFIGINVALWTWVYTHPAIPWVQVWRSLFLCQNLLHAPGWFFVES